MTGNEYQQLALRTLNKKLSLEDMYLEGLMGLSGEAGEALDILKKHMFQEHDLDDAHIFSELGDCLWYIAEAAYAKGWNFDDLMVGNIRKLELRYPNGFEMSRSITRCKDDI